MEIREVEIGSLKPYTKNAKTHDAKQIAQYDRFQMAARQGVG